MHFDSGTQKCMTYFKKHDSLASANYWVVGLPIYRAYMINHNMATNQMGFGTYPPATSTSFILPVTILDRAYQLAVSGILVLGVML